MSTGLLEGIQKPPAWVEEGLCGQADPDQWIQDASMNPIPAKRICQSCPVQTECLEYAVVNNEKYGIWGGTSPRERNEIRKERGIAGEPPQFNQKER